MTGEQSAQVHPSVGWVGLLAGLASISSTAFVAAGLFAWNAPVSTALWEYATQALTLLPLSLPLGLFGFLYGRRWYKRLGLAAALAGAVLVSLWALLVTTWTSDVGWTNATIGRNLWGIVEGPLIWGSVAVAIIGRKRRAAQVASLAIAIASVGWIAVV